MPRRSRSRTPKRSGSPTRKRDGDWHPRSPDRNSRDKGQKKRSNSRNKERRRSNSRHRSPKKSRSPSRKSRSPRRSRSPRKSRRRSHSRSRSRNARRRDSRSRSRSTRRRRGSDRNGTVEPDKCIGVFGLSYRTTDRDLEDEFRKYGELDTVKLICHPVTKESRGFAFLTYRRIEDSQEAVQKCNGMALHGRKIRVDFSMTKGPHQPTPGRYLGESTQGKDEGESTRGGRSRSRTRSRSPRRKSPVPTRTNGKHDEFGRERR